LSCPRADIKTTTSSVTSWSASAVATSSAETRSWYGTEVLVAEEASVAAATGSPIAPYTLLRLRALQGREAEASAAIASAVEQAAAEGQGMAAMYAHWAAAVLYNGLARYPEAASAARQATADTVYLYPSMWALPELIEADSDAIVSEIDRFLRSVRDEEAELDRVLATVMFTDIVGSTERTTILGDRAWGELLADHDRVVRGSVARYHGREIKTVGDGLLATLDGPARAVRCALAITSAVRDLGIDVRIGVHTGEIELDDDVVGASRSTSAPACRRSLSRPRCSS